MTMTEQTPPVNRSPIGRGRKHGAIVIANRLIAKELANDGGTMPLEVLVHAMRDYWDDWLNNKDNPAKLSDAIVSRERAVIVADKCAPYFHARLAAVEVSGDVTVKSVVRVPDVAKDVTSWAKQHAPEIIDVEPEYRDPPKKPSVLMR